MRASSFWRYTAFQFPGWIIAILSGWSLNHWFDAPLWVSSGILIVWIIKDYALYPFLRAAYELNEKRPIDRLIGEYGTVKDSPSSNRYILVRGELWRAQLDETRREEMPSLISGTLVEVIGVKGSVLLVRPAPSKTENALKATLLKNSTSAQIDIPDPE